MVRKLPAPSCYSIRKSAFCSVLVLVGLTLGCDKVETLVEDAKKDMSTSPVAEAPVAAPQQPAAQPTPTPQPTGPSAETVLASLKSKTSHVIDDNTLIAVAAMPEAASQVTELDLRANLQVTNAGLAAVGKFPNLSKLQLSGIQKPESADFAVLGTLNALTVLEADQTKLGNEAIPALAGLAQLKSLSLKNTPLQGNALAALSNLKNLEELLIDNTGTDDSATVGWNSLPLKKLSISSTRITNTGFATIAECETLEWLNISTTGINGLAFQKVKLPELKTLFASHTNFGAPGVINIRKLPKLEELGLFQAGLELDNGTRFDNRIDFKSFPVLAKLNIGGNQLSDIGVNALIAGSKNLEELSMTELPRVTNAGFGTLLKCKNLKRVDISRTGINMAGVQEMKKRNPNIEISLDGMKY